MSTNSAFPEDKAGPGHVDVLIVGAGLSGIGAACHLQTDAPGTSYAIVEARGASGGTWDLFRYPGVRSDSDMFTLGFPFRPWTGGNQSSAAGRSCATSARPRLTTASTGTSPITAASWRPNGQAATPGGR